MYFPEIFVLVSARQKRVQRVRNEIALVAWVALSAGVQC